MDGTATDMDSIWNGLAWIAQRMGEALAPAFDNAELQLGRELWLGFLPPMTRCAAVIGPTGGALAPHLAGMHPRQPAMAQTFDAILRVRFPQKLANGDLGAARYDQGLRNVLRAAQCIQRWLPVEPQEAPRRPVDFILQLSVPSVSIDEVDLINASGPSWHWEVDIRVQVGLTSRQLT